MTVLTEVKPEVVFDVTYGVEAEMLVAAYVPEYDPRVMTWQEAVALAELRDEQAAAELEQGALDLEASILATLDAEDPAEDGVAADVVNFLLANAERADRKEREANGPWEVLTP